MTKDSAVKSRTKRLRNGHKLIQVMLTPEGKAALRELKRSHKTNTTAAVNRALIGYNGAIR